MTTSLFVCHFQKESKSTLCRLDKKRSKRQLKCSGTELQVVRKKAQSWAALPASCSDIAEARCVRFAGFYGRPSTTIYEEDEQHFWRDTSQFRYRQRQFSWKNVDWPTFFLSLLPIFLPISELQNFPVNSLDIACTSSRNTVSLQVLVGIHFEEWTMVVPLKNFKWILHITHTGPNRSFLPDSYFPQFECKQAFLIFQSVSF